MEKSSAVVLSDEEKDMINGKGPLVKTADEGENIPERFKGWYTEKELKEIANGSK